MEALQHDLNQEVIPLRQGIKTSVPLPPMTIALPVPGGFQLWRLPAMRRYCPLSGPMMQHDRIGGTGGKRWACAMDLQIHMRESGLLPAFCCAAVTSNSCVRIYL